MWTLGLIWSTFWVSCCFSLLMWNWMRLASSEIDWSMIFWHQWYLMTMSGFWKRMDRACCCACGSKCEWLCCCRSCLSMQCLQLCRSSWLKLSYCSLVDSGLSEACCDTHACRRSRRWVSLACLWFWEFQVWLDRHASWDRCQACSLELFCALQLFV